jgi:hypothetical protein
MITLSGKKIHGLLTHCHPGASLHSEAAFVAGLLGSGPVQFAVHTL